MISIKTNGITYSNIFENIEWSGSIKTSCRTLEVTYLKDKADFELGQEIEFIVDKRKIFIGKIFRISQNTNEETYFFKAYDNAIMLNKNSFIENFCNIPPSNIVKNILGKLKIEIGKLPLDKTKCTYPALDRTGYEIILMAYKLQSAKDNVIYSVVSENNKISIIEQGTLIPNFTLSSSINIREAKYSESIEDMVNKVILYETVEGESKTITIKENSKDKAKYGVFQKVQEQDKNNEVYLQVNKILKGVQESSDLTVDGDVSLMSGFSVPIKVKTLSKLNLTFLIETDRHVWTNNDYITYITLAFENVMNDVEIDKTNKKKEEFEVIQQNKQEAGDNYE